MKKLERLENWEDIKSKVEETFNKECCKGKVYEEIKKSCRKCGNGIKLEQVTMSLVGSDVVALYPSLTSERTGRIVRESIEKSEVKFEGFDDEKGRAYIGINRGYAGNLTEIEHTLPTRASNKGSTPTMASIGPKWDPNNQWVFPKEKITEKERRKILAKVAEIAVRILWEKFS